MKILSLIYPLLLSAVPILFLAAHNADQVEARLIVLPVGVALAGTAILLAMALLAFRNAGRAAAAVTLGVILFFAYGHAFDALRDGASLSTRQTHAILSGISALFAVAGVVLIARTRIDLARLAPAATLFASILLLFSTISLATSPGGEQTGEILPTIAEGRGDYPAAAPILEDRADLPDIYFIVLDGYARGDVLRDLYDFDNAGFLKDLRSRGFYVARRSVSNYPLTFLSLASTLNMRYLNDIANEIGRKRKARGPIYGMIRAHDAGRFLQSKGYRYVHFNTNYGGTETSDIADITFAHPSLIHRHEFLTVLVRTTMLRALEPRVADLHLFMMDALKELPAIDGPTFTVAHLLLPHNPYVFDRAGNIRADVPLDLQWTEKTGGWAAKDEYIDQLVYTNGRILEIIDHILATSTHPPIIILQSDHGSATTYPGDDAPRKQWGPFTRERTAILNAWLVPNAVREELHPAITPVNTFRLLFSKLFDAPLEMLPDESYMSWYTAPYRLRNVTDEVLAKSSRPASRRSATTAPADENDADE